MSDKKSTYTAAAKAFYERHREEILAKEKESKRWIEYYAKNKEKISERRKERRKLKPKPVPAIDEDKIKRYEEIMKELPELKKEVLKKQRLAKKAPGAETPGVTPSERTTSPE